MSLSKSARGKIKELRRKEGAMRDLQTKLQQSKGAREKLQQELQEKTLEAEALSGKVRPAEFIRFTFFFKRSKICPSGLRCAVL